MFSLLRTSLVPRASRHLQQISTVGLAVRALHLKKDDTPDMRFAENSKGRLGLKKDGTPDLRFKANIATYSPKKNGGLTKTGKPDMRCKENQLAQMNASANKEA
ncbi:hypothetical protein BDY24DRAFT_103316 [Mrakia frigida]|uniref:uncharacterized protein n=1 Tax=Mrakia frigida TaxID=29902 RepID=UPI003FCC1E60